MWEEDKQKRARAQRTLVVKLALLSAWNQQNNINCIGVQEEISQVLAKHQLPTKFVGMDLPCESWTRARGGGGGPHSAAMV